MANAKVVTEVGADKDGTHIVSRYTKKVAGKVQAVEIDITFKDGWVTFGDARCAMAMPIEQFESILPYLEMWGEGRNVARGH